MASLRKACRPSEDTGSGPLETAGGQGPVWTLTHHLLLPGGPRQTSRPPRETGRQAPVSAPVTGAQGEGRSPGPWVRLHGPRAQAGAGRADCGALGGLPWLPWRGRVPLWGRKQGDPSRAGPWPRLSGSLICPCRKPWQRVSRRQSPGRSHNTPPGTPGKAGAAGEAWRWRPAPSWALLCSGPASGASGNKRGVQASTGCAPHPPNYLVPQTE